MSTPTRPRFAVLTERLGVDLDAPVIPPPVDGPVFGPCDDQPCSGKLRIQSRGSVIWELECDTCGYEAGVPARKVDPAIQRRLRVEQAGIPDRFRGLRFEEDEENREALQMVREWIAAADENPVDRASSLLPAPGLYGDAGRGKSHLLAAVCLRLVRELDLSVLFRSARQLLRELQRFEDARGTEQFWRRLVSVDVLALDDLGAQRGTDWRHDQLADLIDERYQAERPILVATNYRPELWGDVLDERTHSRLREMTFDVELRGRDRRLSSESEDK